MILKIYPEELLPMKFCVINNLKSETICIWCVAKKTCCNDLKLAVGGIKSEVRPNKQLAEKLHKPLGMLRLQKCNWWADITGNSAFAMCYWYFH